MTKKIVVGYDGSGGSHSAIDFAVELAKSQNATLIVGHVLEWSPYSFLTPSELEERHKRRQEELNRANDAVMTPLLKDIEAKGVKAEGAIKYGHIAETLVTIASDAGADIIVVGRTGHSQLASRLFGSVAGSLAQISPVPVTIVP